MPASGGQVTAGRVAVAGVAWAQHRGIRAVEVRVDDGPWQRGHGSPPSRPSTPGGSGSWSGTPPRATTRSRVRAIDGTGAVQTEREAPPAPDGASGWHSVTVTAG